MAPLAVLATAVTIPIGMALGGGASPSQSPSAGAGIGAAADVGTREGAPVSRSNSRVAPPRTYSVKAPALTSKVATKAAIRAAKQKKTQLWTTEDLNLWAEPGKKAEKVGEIPAAEQVLVTGRMLWGRVEVVVDGKSRWVTDGFLATEKPFSIGAPCTNGTSVPSGVSPNIVKVHEAVCGNFPEISVYGTFRSDGEHSQGLAVDIMVSGDRGWEVAEFVREHYAELGVNYLIYSQQIWSVERSSEGWRGMSDRGSATANHYDHVHVTTY
ncbi:mucin-2 protein [Nocardioides sp. SYSU D00038]|uniref:mucin-2 protein n=1 Tax=Nocardioides sp. SYSU D00038 TaxID=2812554 RepID=UPI001967D03A|nr:mucin-2 protein [Nocardioides sp. SYSU D00038]